MPALPSPEFSWRRAAARRLRDAAALLERGAGDGGSAGAGDSAGAGGSASARGSDGTRGRGPVPDPVPGSPESTTAAHGFDLDGAPEHWVQLLRDAGLAPPDARPALRPLTRFRRAHQAPQLTPATPSSMPTPAPAPEGQAPPVVGPALRAWKRLRGAQRASQVAQPIPAPQPGPSLPIPSSSESPLPDSTQPSDTYPSSGSRQRSVPQEPGAGPVVRPALRVRIRSKGAEQAPQPKPSEAPPLVGPGVLALAPREGAEQAPQPMPVLRLRPARPRSLPHAPTNVAGPGVRATTRVEDAEQAPQHTAASVAGPNMRDSSAPKRAELAPQHTSRRHDLQRKERQPRPEPKPQAQAQGHPSAVVNHSPAPATNGTWPELTPRPNPIQPAPLTPLENAMSRQTRLHNEQLAV